MTVAPALLIEDSGNGIVEIRLNRPDRLNAVTVELVEGLHDQLRELASRRDVRAVILTGSGRGFCAGLDLNGYGTPPHADGVGRVHVSWSVQRHISLLVSEMRALPHPIIAAVNGPAAGGGLALMLASDIRLASKSATFAVSFIRAGFSACDIGVSWLLPRVVGVARAQELMLTGRTFESDEALRIGLVVEVVDDDQLLATARRYADMVASNSPMGVSLTKEAMWTALEIPMSAAIDLENRQQVLIAQTDDSRAQRRSFFDRQQPTYKNS
jgi:enoyl-CoA hydratase/carnithine racemase